MVGGGKSPRILIMYCNKDIAAFLADSNRIEGYDIPEKYYLTYLEYGKQREDLPYDKAQKVA